MLQNGVSSIALSVSIKFLPPRKGPVVQVGEERLGMPLSQAHPPLEVIFHLREAPEAGQPLKLGFVVSTELAEGSDGRAVPHSIGWADLFVVDIEASLVGVLDNVGFQLKA
uniref:Uncharacterized protein n=1 Tax=Strombidium inclinatum TaxID=197538 RepID=A0A7S3ISH2_9SPIT